MDIDYDLFEEIDVTFSKHLREEGNHRLLFSGPFGVGKTTFLNYFFNKEDVKDRYVSVFLSPINYSILANEDVVKYVKYDLLYKIVELFPKSFEKNFISYLTASEVYLSNNLLDTLISLALIAPGYGKQAHKFLEITKGRIDDMIDMKKSAESKFYQLEKYASGLNSISGSLYENDSISMMIEDVLVQNSKGKKILLIIDDIDRIDPHHVFRLFNVFSAHLETRIRTTGRTKFGFNKVVFVCDEENIRKLYQKFYGVATDYNGYIDKFYSKRIFQFNNKARLRLKIESIINNLKFDSEELYIIERLKDPHQYFTSFVINLFEALVKLKVVKIRTLVKWGRGDISIGKSVVYVDRANTIRNYKIDVILLFDILISLLGSPERLSEVLELLVQSKYLFDYDFEDVLKDCIALIEVDKHNFEHLRQFKHKVHDGQYLEFKYIRPMGPKEVISIQYAGVKTKIDDSLAFSYLLKAFNQLQKFNYY